MDTDEPPDFDSVDHDTLYYHISNQEWQNMTITSPDGRVRYFTETERSFLPGKRKKQTTVISKAVDEGAESSSSASSTKSGNAVAKRVIARFEFRHDAGQERVMYGMKEYPLDDFFPPVRWPQGFRRVEQRGDDGWTWIGMSGEPALLDANGRLLSYYLPNLKRLSMGKNGRLAISSDLSSATVDLVITGFILAMRDADKLFGHLGLDVSPRPGFGGATYGSISNGGIPAITTLPLA